MRNVTKLLWNVTEALRSRCVTLHGITETLWKRYGTFRRSVVDRYGKLRNVIEALWKRCRVLLSVANIKERCRTLRDVTEALRIVMECYGSVTEPLRNVTEPLRKISILPITNSIFNFAHHYNVGVRALRYIVLFDLPKQKKFALP